MTSKILKLNTKQNSSFQNVFIIKTQTYANMYLNKRENAKLDLGKDLQILKVWTKLCGIILALWAQPTKFPRLVWFEQFVQRHQSILYHTKHINLILGRSWRSRGRLARLLWTLTILMGSESTHHRGYYHPTVGI